MNVSRQSDARVSSATINQRGNLQFQKHGFSRAEVLYDTDPMDLCPAALVPPPVAILDPWPRAAGLAGTCGSVFPKGQGTCYSCNRFRAWRASAAPNSDRDGVAAPFIPFTPSCSIHTPIAIQRRFIDR